MGYYVLNSSQLKRGADLGDSCAPTISKYNGGFSNKKKRQQPGFRSIGVSSERVANWEEPLCLLGHMLRCSKKQE